MLVAVYGTLKTGEANYARLLSGKTPAFSGFVETPYRMYANDAYPMLVPSRSKNRVYVEVFEVDENEMRELDALEAPYQYWRERVHLREWGHGGTDVAIYVHAAPPPEGFAAVPSGIWKSKTGQL